MAVTQASDLFIPEVCIEYASQKFVQSIDLMQQMVGGEESPIQIMNDPIFSSEGQYIQRPVFTRIGSTLVTRRDITSTSSVTPLKLAGSNEIGVKVHRKIGPVDVSEDAARLSRATPAEISQELGKQMGEELALNMQHTLIAASLGALDGISGTAHTLSVWSATARTNLSPDLLNRALELMGDQRQKFRTEAKILTRSESHTDLYTDALGRNFPGVGDRALKGDMYTNDLGMGPACVVDDSLLTTADAGFDKYHTLLLGKGFMQVWFTLPFQLYPVFGPILDQEQVIIRLRADADFAVGVHGKQWDVANGGANPSDSTIATSTNWDDTFSNHREVRGLKITHNYSNN